MKIYYQEVWMIQISNKFILNNLFGWALQKNTPVLASFGTWKRWYL